MESGATARGGLLLGVTDSALHVPVEQAPRDGCVDGHPQSAPDDDGLRRPQLFQRPARHCAAVPAKRGAAKFHNLLGSLDTDKITEEEARAIDHKWSPVRHHKNDFQSVSFDGDMLRIYARVYARDLYFYGYTDADEVPELETVFVLSLGTGDEDDDVYNELRDQLGAFVETAVIETDIDIDNEGD
jgi:hypothetical protein